MVAQQKLIKTINKTTLVTARSSLFQLGLLKRGWVAVSCHWLAVLQIYGKLNLEQPRRSEILFTLIVLYRDEDEERRRYLSIQG